MGQPCAFQVVGGLGLRLVLSAAKAACLLGLGAALVGALEWLAPRPETTEPREPGLRAPRHERQLRQYCAVHALNGLFFDKAADEAALPRGAGACQGRVPASWRVFTPDVLDAIAEDCWSAPPPRRPAMHEAAPRAWRRRAR
jgi:hypothetical protein